MSLLMDALKKAERERAAQASKEQDDAEEAASQELSLDPIEQRDTDDASLASSDDHSAVSESVEGLGDEPPVGQDFDLNFDDVDLDFDAPASDDSGAAGRDVPPVFDDVPLSTEPEEEISLEDTSSTMPSMKAVKASVDRYFDGGASSASLSMPMPSVEQDDATTVVRTRDSAEAQAAARTVFEAKNRRRKRTWVWIPASLVAVLLLIGGGIYFYFSSITGNQGRGGVQDIVAVFSGGPAAGSAGTVQTGTPPPAAVDPVVAPAVTADTAADVAGSDTPDAETAVQNDDFVGMVEEPTLEEVLAIEPPPSGDLTPVEPVAQVEPETMTEAEPQEPPMTSEELLASADQHIAAALADQALLGGAEQARESGFKLTSRQVPARVNPKVQRGYEAFQRNDFATAEREYRSVLGGDPNNRDALLGIAAIAVAKNRTGLAAQIYSEILRVNPRDSIASSALMSLQNNPTTTDESRLKLMLEREPNADHLHFSLGNYFASQQRWSEAQNAYFNAFRLDSDNPDYAYNLAIGLDHMAQPQAALKYYQLALELASNEPSGFERAAVQRRIESIAK